MNTAKANAPDPKKVFAAIAAIISRREGRVVRLVDVKKASEDKDRKAG